ncbi:glycosyltransferase family 4 protein [Nesterenkonia sp.]|uniref:glycosyltransferase family 4 protein n=1 Tax=Nesterenkonia sp. TaxID=704201 RepID=UPI00262B5CB8|nr:glycosyltransferase family 4 protein [Nesterenkonia sp.]
MPAEPQPTAEQSPQPGAPDPVPAVAHAAAESAAPASPQAGQPGTPVVGYVLKMYPRFSETFIVSEILAREAAGERIVIFSLRTPTDARFHAELARVKAPVIQIPRTSNASKMWERIGEVAGQQDLQTGIARALPDLLASESDDAFQAVMLAQAAREAGVTHLHAHFASVATTVARLAGMIAGLPYSFTAHAKDIFHEEVDQQLLQRKLAEAHHAVTISEYNLRHLRRCFPDATATLHLVRNGLNLDRFPYTPQRPQRAVPRILAVGRLVEKKGFGLLIDAVAQLRSRGIRVTADIAGDGPLAAELEEKITAYDLHDDVHLLGPRTQAEITELLGSHDVFAAPFVIGSDGNADGLPTVLLEAMARGIRCVAADVTAVGEVIRGEPHSAPDSGPWRRETGWLVPTGDLQALTEALAEAVQPGDHTAMTDAARRLVAEQFDSHRQAQQLRALVASPTGAAAPQNGRQQTEPGTAARSAPAAPAAAIPAAEASRAEAPASLAADHALGAPEGREVRV